MHFITAMSHLILELRSKKKLLLVFSYDRPEHADVVYRLRIYLMYKCGCDVSWTLSVPETEAYHWEGWLLQQLDMADRVLVVNSEPAYWKYTTSKRNVSAPQIAKDVIKTWDPKVPSKSMLISNLCRYRHPLKSVLGLCD